MKKGNTSIAKKPGTYYFPPRLNNYTGNFPGAFSGFNPGTTAGAVHEPGSLCTYAPPKASDVHVMYQSLAGDTIITEELLRKDSPKDRIRDAAGSIGITSHWMAIFLLTFSFPVINETIGWANNFWLYGAVCMTGFIVLNGFCLRQGANRLNRQL
jgi:hypothetical protein